MSDVGMHRGCRARVATALCVLACCVGTATAQPVGIPYMTVEVFVNSAMAVTVPAASLGLQVSVHRMDQLDMATQAIDQQIPRGSEAEARRWVEANQARIKRQVQPAAIATANAISLATHYRIDRLPAVVINKKTVVYGVTDVNVALQHYQASRGGRP
jgi:integrating conjugative element protein (TIGR03757 family)